MTTSEELRDLVEGRWVGTYTEMGRPYPTEIGFTSNTKVSGPGRIDVHGSARDRFGMYDVRGTITRDDNWFDFTQRRGWVRGRIDPAAMSMSGSWSRNPMGLDGSINLKKEISDEDRRRDAERQKEKEEAEARRKQAEEDARQAELARQKQEEEEAERQRQAEAEARQRQEDEERRQAEVAQREREDELKRQAHADAEAAQREAAKTSSHAPAGSPQQDSATAALHDLPPNEPDPNDVRNVTTTSSVATSDAVKVITTRGPTLAPRKSHHLPLKLNKTVDIDVYIKVITAIHGDAPMQLL